MVPDIFHPRQTRPLRKSTHSETKALENLMSGRTSLIIAHRLSTILTADKIVVMESGQIRSVGNHQQLLEKCPLYKRLYTLQFQAQPEG
jgi:ATP-binding cassette, subfamily B, bacterial MsbA